MNSESKSLAYILDLMKTYFSVAGSCAGKLEDGKTNAVIMTRTENIP